MVSRLRLLIVTLCFAVTGCGNLTNSGKYYDNDGPPLAGGELRAALSKNAVPKVEPPHKWANRPYKVMGQRFHPMTGDKPFTQTGTASWYGKQFHGKKTAIGEIYNMYDMTAAHPTMELPSYARVTNLKNGRSVIVRVNDRGPFIGGRVIDMSYAAAVKLGYQKQGTTRVRVERITRRDIAAGRVPSTGITGSLLALGASVASSNRTSNPRNQERVSSSSRVIASAPENNTATNIHEPSQSSEVVSTPVATQTMANRPDDSACVPSAVMSFDVVDVPNNDQTNDTDRQETARQILALTQKSPIEPATSVTIRESAVSDSTPTASGNAALDPIDNILTAQAELDAQKAASAQRETLSNVETATPSTSSMKANVTTNVPTPDWSVQVGAFGVEENARQAAAHAEMMVSERSYSTPVRVVKDGSVYRVLVGKSATHQGAIKLAQQLSDDLGLKAFAVQK